ncbi:MAG: hypothetical protein ACLSAF_03245 [Intestinimonas sp.]
MIPELGDSTFPEIVAQVHHHMRSHISCQKMQAVITRNVMLQGAVLRKGGRK